MGNSKSSDSLVLGVVAAADGESLIDNLTEQDFSEKDISYILADTARARQIIADAGPLEGVTDKNLFEKLKSLQVKDAQQYVTLVEQGMALIAVTTPTTAVAALKESLADYHAKQVIVI